MSLWYLIAQSTPAPAPGGGGGFDFLLVILLMVVGYYFFIAMPQKRDRAERQKMLNALAKGDKVITSSGIHGKVIDISKKGDIEVVARSGRALDNVNQAIQDLKEAKLQDPN